MPVVAFAAEDGLCGKTWRRGEDAAGIDDPGAALFAGKVDDEERFAAEDDDALPVRVSDAVLEVSLAYIE